MMIRQLTHKECMTLLDNIRNSPPGDWTHDLTAICKGPVKFVERLILPGGDEVVYFRNEQGADAMIAANWDLFAVAREVTGEVEQLTLF